MLLIAGPCVIESAEHTLRLAESLAAIARRVELPLVFKASFDKANRTSVHSYRGPGLEAGLRILSQVRDAVGVPVLSDVHEPGQAAAAACQPVSTSPRGAACAGGSGGQGHP